MRVIKRHASFKACKAIRNGLSEKHQDKLEGNKAKFENNDFS